MSMDFEQIAAASPAELAKLLAGDAPMDRKAYALEQLGRRGTAAEVPALAAWLDDRTLSNRVCEVLVQIPGEESLAALRAGLESKRPETRTGCMDALAERGDETAVETIKNRISEPGALAALAKLATPEAMEAVIRQLQASPAPDAWEAAVAAVGTLLDRGQNERALALIKKMGVGEAPKAVAACLPSLSEQARMVPLFDGQTLAGWEGDPKWFRVVNGVIVGGSLEEPIPLNEFLVTTRDYGDFELRLKVRISDKAANGGIQFRSERLPGTREMIGYQADVGVGFWGHIYDESRARKILNTRPESSDRLVQANLNPYGWNDYRIRAEGPQLRLWLNGVLSARYEEKNPDNARIGKIGLQIHSGPPSTVEYKDLRLLELG